MNSVTVYDSINAKNLSIYLSIFYLSIYLSIYLWIIYALSLLCLFLHVLFSFKF